MRRNRLWWRITCIYLMAVSVALAGLTLVAHQQIVFQRDAGQLTLLRSLGSNLSAELAPRWPVAAADLKRILQTRGGQAGARFVIFDPNGQVLADSQDADPRARVEGNQPEIQQILAGKLAEWQRGGSASGELASTLLIPILAEQRVVAALLVSQPSLGGNLGAEFWLPVLLIWLLACLAGSGAIWFWMQPLSRLASAAQLLTQGELAGLPLPLQETEELQSLTSVFNRLTEQLEERSFTIGRKGTEHETVLASMVEGVLAVDSEERILTLNQAAANLVGARPGEGAGRKLSEVIRNADLRRFVLRALDSPASVEDDILLHGERNRILQAHGTTLRDTRSRPIGAVIVLNDVTHTRHLENIRRDFVANVSHELKTPIASIKGFVETLLDGALHNPADAERFLRIVVKQADRLNTIIEDLLSLSKIEQSEEAGNLVLEETNIHLLSIEAIQDCQSRATERQVTVELECAEDLTTLANPRLLLQAIINLLDNAMKYSESGSAVQLHSQRHNGEIVISVEDHGVGIDPEHLPRLFERFYRVDKARSRKLGGTGLGLSIVKHIVQAHRGRVDVQSQPGKGSRFSIYLPWLPPAA
ncbi:MAG: ATP-binding protein [Pirellulales bacterium]|nr:ATP-binding protein [Pirellulales bacterium]